MTIYAKLASRPMDDDCKPYYPNKGDLVCVELPANCAVDGGVSELREMLQDAVAIACRRNRSVYSLPEDGERLAAIELWLAKEGP